MLKKKNKSLKNKPVLQFKLPEAKLCVYTSRPSFDFIEINQTHSDLNFSFELINQDTTGDGIYTQSKTYPPLAIKTADCLPIVVIGTKGHAIIHAGWRGLASKNFIKKEILELKPYYFFIGPSIQKKSFKVTKEFILNFPAGKHFYSDNHFDLQGFAAEQILKALPDATIKDCFINTHGHHQLHSYRQSQTSQRNWNILFSDKDLLKPL